MGQAIKAVPDGHRTVTPHLVVRGAAGAIAFYKEAFGAVEHVRMPAPGGKQVMHAEITIGDSHLFLADEFPEMGGKSPEALGGSPVTIHLYVEDVDATVAKAVEAGATLVMPVANMPWGDRYGRVNDPFGHSWSVATHVEDVTREQMIERMAGACADAAEQVAKVAPSAS
jgi:PhnB protein